MSTHKSTIYTLNNALAYAMQWTVLNRVKPSRVVIEEAKENGPDWYSVEITYDDEE